MPDKLRQMLARVWGKNEGALQERLQAIRRGYEVLSSACVDGQTQIQIQTKINDSRRAEARIDARNAAHKLAGVLGTFDLARGTELAREAEVLLDQPEKLEPAKIARLGSLHAELEAMIATKSKELKPA